MCDLFSRTHRPVPHRDTSPRSAPVEPAKEIRPEASDVDVGGEEDLPGGVEGGVPGPVRVGGAITAPARFATAPQRQTGAVRPDRDGQFQFGLVIAF